MLSTGSSAPRRLALAFAVSALTIAVASCAALTTAAPKTDVCAIFQPIYLDEASVQGLTDTDVLQIAEHNAVFESLCPED